MSSDVGDCSGEEDKLEYFLRWATEKGISDQPSPAPSQPIEPSGASCLGQALRIAYFPDAGGRGLAAAREIMRGEIVLKVPRSALLTKENVLNDEKIAACINRHSHLSATQVLTVCLLAEVGKGKSSWWYPYLTQLPRGYNLLATFKNPEIQAFQVGDAIRVADEVVSKSQSDWKQALVLMQEIDITPRLQTFKSWLWAFATVSSRALHVPWDCAGCLCPVGDFFNYDAPGKEYFAKDTTEGPLIDSQKYEGHSKLCREHDECSLRLTDGGFEEELNSYCFYARRNYQKGEQVLLCYGTYTNLELLEHYGFLLDANPNDKIFIMLDSTVHACSPWSKDSLYTQQDGRASYALLCALRLWATPAKLRKSSSRLVYSGSKLSLENEITIMQFLSKSCHDTLKELPTSAEDDWTLLQNIDNILGRSFVADSTSWLPFPCELNIIIGENSPHKDSSAVLMPKNMRSLERIRLAVQWRLVYKRALLNCISYCNDVIIRLLEKK